MIAIGIQARQTSTRLPGKVFYEISDDKSILEHVYDICSSTGVPTTVLIPDTVENDELSDFCYKKLMTTFRGSEYDVIKRYLDWAETKKIDDVVRITSDCPMLDPLILEGMISVYKRNYYQFMSNASPYNRTYPDGWDVEIVSLEALRWLDRNTTGENRQHVTSALYTLQGRNAFNTRLVNGAYPLYQTMPKISIDTAEDYSKVASLMSIGREYGTREPF